ncbi:MAG: cyclic nucleotide-binding domain-containing protein, partial [Bacillota bacterium]
MSTNPESNSLDDYSTEQQLIAGQDLFTYGAPANQVYLILDGLIRLFVKDEQEQEEEIDRLKAGDIVGESALLATEERSLRATAYEPTSLMVFTPDNLHTVLQKRAIL